MDDSTRERPGQGAEQGGGSGRAGDPFARTADVRGGRGRSGGAWRPGRGDGDYGDRAHGYAGADGAWFATDPNALTVAHGFAGNSDFAADPDFERTQRVDMPHQRGGARPDAQRSEYGDQDLRPPRRISRRVLFASGGLALVAGVALAKADGPRTSTAGGAPAGSASGVRGHAAGASSTLSPSRGGAGAGSPGAGSPSGPAGSGSATPGGPAQGAGGSASGSPGGSASGTPGGGAVTAPEYYVHAGAKAIALTIDDGPTAEYTPQVLAILRTYGVKATFNMIGRQVGANKALVAQVAAEGHTVANHTWDHADQSKLTLAKVLSEINRTNDALQEAGQNPTIFRAPYGAWSQTVFHACAQANLRPVDWSVDPQDWARPGTSAIVDRIMSTTRTGSIILEHDGGGDRSQTVAALKIVIPRLLDDGYHFVGV